MNILITGTSSGLGKALATEFLETGASVYGISRNSNEQLNKYPGYHHLSQDLSQLEILPEKLNEFLDGVGTLDLVILNAATIPNADNNGRIPMSEVSYLMQVNVWANKVILDTLFRSLTTVYQVVAFTSGSLINSIRDLHTYCLSKTILNKLIYLYAREVPATHFTALAPGLIDSGLQEYISQLTNSKDCPVIGKLRRMRKNGQMASTRFAANYLVEAMGSVMQQESGSFWDVGELLPPENGTHSKTEVTEAVFAGMEQNEMAGFDPKEVYNN